jgi:peptidoglycan/LPS O-acetylase OafA/YrhL
MNIRRARGIISLFWIISAGLLIILVSFQTILGKYGHDWEIVWSWLTPLVFPILSLVVAVWTLSNNPVEEKAVRSLPIFWGAMLLSIFYMVLLWGVVLLEPLSELSWTDIMKWSGWYLGIIQGVVAGAIGKFFVEYVH